MPLFLTRSTIAAHHSFRTCLRPLVSQFSNSSAGSHRERNSASFSSRSSSSSDSSSPFFMDFTRQSILAAVGLVLGTAVCYSGSPSQLTSEPTLSEAKRVSEEAEKIALNPKDWVPFKLEETQKVNHNTKLLRFVFDPDQRLGLEVASCLLTRAEIGTNAEGKPNSIIRPYTPISDPEAKGFFNLLIKIYPEGKMSQHIGSLQPGDTLEIKGPISKLPYKPNMRKNIGMVAGGTGITPMLQVIDAILKKPDDLTKVFLIYANISPDDILLKEKLDALQTAHPNFKVYYVVDKETKDWMGGTGYITKDIILKGLPSPSDDTLVLVCGPPGMMRHISGDKDPDKTQGEVSGLLKEAGYTKDMVYKF